MHHGATSPADRRFCDQVADGRWPLAQFDHRAHLRLAYCCLASATPEAALARVRTLLTGYLRHHAVDPAKYHETLTTAWVLAVLHRLKATPASASAEAFIDAHPQLLDTRFLLTHYSAERLYGAEARERFLPPDLAPLPQLEAEAMP